jgi:serine/threonine protein phosphatase PrpC
VSTWLRFVRDLATQRSFGCWTSKENQDATLRLEENDGTLWIGVADGLGGHFGGAVAANFVVSELPFALPRANNSLGAAFKNLHDDLRDRQSRDPALTNMATTLTVAILQGDRLRGAHCATRVASLLEATG